MSAKRGICVSINSLSRSDVQKLEDVLRNSGINILETVENTYHAYQDDYYGVDGDGDAIFYSTVGGFSDTGDRADTEVLSYEAFLQRFDGSAGQSQPTNDSEAETLYRIIGHDGTTYIFRDLNEIRECLQSAGGNKDAFACLVYAPNGSLVGNRLGMTDLGILEAGFVIQDF